MFTCQYVQNLSFDTLLNIYFKTYKDDTHFKHVLV